MRRLWTSALLACGIVLCSDLKGKGSVPDLPAPNSTTAANESAAADHLELSILSDLPNTPLDCSDVSPAVLSQNDTTRPPLVNKCCPRNHHLDVENLRCVAGGVGEEQVAGELVREGLPDCGVEGVMSVRVVSRAEGLSGKYCMDRRAEHPLERVVVACEEAVGFCRTRTCYRKCCPLGYGYGLSERRCKRTEEPFRPVFYNLSSLLRVESMGPWEGGIYFSDGCGSKGKFLLERDLGEVSYLGADGTLLVPAFGKRFPESEFCVEVFFLLSLGFIISCMFLVLTFLVYLLSPNCHNLYGKTLMCYIACLFTAYLCLAVIELKSKEVDRTVCTHMGYFLLFAFLAAFFWLNVISFDIWKTFRLNRTVERSKTDKGNFQLLWYSFYAWGFPSTITFLCAYANQSHAFPYEDIRPDIGVENCWFSKKKKGIYVFFIAPISLIITLNIVFYVQTAWKIWKVKADVKKMESTNRFSANKDQFIINGKLFIVMGITWSLEIISFFAPHPIWYITDTANALHGVFIFAVFVLKKKVLQQVSHQVRAPLKRMKQLTTSQSDDPSARNNLQPSNKDNHCFSVCSTLPMQLCPPNLSLPSSAGRSTSKTS